MKKAVIFDLDGTLIDSEPMKTVAYNRALKKLFGKGIPPGKTRHPGAHEIENAQLFLDMLQERGRVEDVIREKRAAYQEMYEQEMKLFKGVINLLDELQKKEIVMAVATGANRESTEYIIEKLNLKDYFSLVMTGDDVQEQKPHPEIFLKTVQRLNQSVGTCIVVEDSMTGIQAAKNAGIYCLGITNTYGEEELHEADEIISEIIQVENFV